LKSVGYEKALYKAGALQGAKVQQDDFQARVCSSFVEKT
jgi:hypothetical protein